MLSVTQCVEYDPNISESVCNARGDTTSPHRVQVSAPDVQSYRQDLVICGTHCLSLHVGMHHPTWKCTKYRARRRKHLPVIVLEATPPENYAQLDVTPFNSLIVYALCIEKSQVETIEVAQHVFDT